MLKVDPNEIGAAWEEPPARESSYVEKALGLALLLILVVGCILILAPFLNAILLAVTLCVSTWPLFRRMELLLRGRRTQAAALMTLIAAGVVLAPVIVLGANLGDGVARINAAVQLFVEGGLPPPSWLGSLPLVGTQAERAWLKASQQGSEVWSNLMPYVGPLRDWALRQGATLVAGALQIALSLILAFFLYRDGSYVEQRIASAMSRLAGWRAGHIMQAAAATITSVVNGVLGTALVQGVLLAFSFWLVGIPGAIVLGAVGMVLSLIPMGLALLWLPASLWLMSQDHTGAAVFVIVWNGLFVGSLDNVLRPYLISRGTKLPAVLILLGVLGGILTFGIVGVFLGPVLLAVAYTLFQDWGSADPESVRTRELI
jgi:predicted PurR-regulated permease PerM